MKHRYLVIATGLLALTAVIALWAASMQSSSPTQSQSSPPSALRTMVPGGGFQFLETLGFSPSAIETMMRITPPPTSTPRPLTPVGSVEEALRLAADWFMGGATFLELAHPKSVSYVETTVGEARQLFERNGPRTAPDVPDDAPAWVFVAHGEFQHFCMGCEVHYSSIFSTVVVVIPKDGQRRMGFPGNQQYDLSQLGMPMEVPSSVLARLCDELVGPSSRDLLC